MVDFGKWKNILHKGISLSKAPFEIRKNPVCVLASLARDASNFTYADMSLQHSIEFVLKAVSQNGMVYRYLDVKFQARQDVAVAAVSNDASVYQCLTDTLKENYQIAFAAVIHSSRELPRISPTLLKTLCADKNFVMTVFVNSIREIKKTVFNNMSLQMCDDHDVMLLAMSELREDVIKKASDRLKNDIRFAAHVLVFDNCFLKDISPKLQENDSFKQLVNDLNQSDRKWSKKYDLNCFFRDRIIDKFLAELDLSLPKPVKTSSKDEAATSVTFFKSEIVTDEKDTDTPSTVPM